MTGSRTTVKIFNDYTELSEAYISSSLRHPNIVQALGLNFEPNSFQILYPNHVRLDSKLKDLTPVQKKIIIKGMFNAVSFLHTETIVHANLSIESVYLDASGNGILCGLSKARLLENIGQRYPYSDKHNSNHAPPETRKGGMAAGIATDRWDLAILALQIATNGDLKISEYNAQTIGQTLSKAMGAEGDIFIDALVALLNTDYLERPAIINYINKQLGVTPTIAINSTYVSWKTVSPIIKMEGSTKAKMNAIDLCYRTLNPLAELSWRERPSIKRYVPTLHTNYHGLWLIKNH